MKKKKRKMYEEWIEAKNWQTAILTAIDKRLETIENVLIQ